MSVYNPVNATPYVFSMIFIAVLQDVTRQEIEILALSRTKLYRDPLVYLGSTKFMGGVIVFIIQMSMQASINYMYLNYGGNIYTQY